MRRENKGKPLESKIEITAIYTVGRSDELLNFLLSKCKTSRNNVKSLLSNRQVMVNGSPVCQFNFALAKDDEVKIAKRPVAVCQPPSRKMQSRPKLSILYEDEDFIAVLKPGGLLSVESDKTRECAFQYVLEYLQAKDKRLRPFILHRIDKETSGVLVFAKNIKLHSMLRQNWNTYVKTREYIAVVEGKMEKKEDTVISYLRENQNNLVYSAKDRDGQKAITHYRVIAENREYSLLEIFIDTGRKNQIRVHMHELGHSIVGDEKYGYTKDPLKRLGLHASKLEFLHPITGKLISIEAKAPNTFYGLFK